MKFNLANKGQPRCSAHVFADGVLLREFGESTIVTDRITQCFVAVADQQVLKLRFNIKNPTIGSKVEFVVDGIVRGAQSIKHRVEELEITFDTAIYARNRSLCRGKLIVVTKGGFVNCPVGLVSVGTVEIRLCYQPTNPISPPTITTTVTRPDQARDYTTLPKPWNSFGITQDSHLDFTGRTLLTQCQRTSFRKLTTESPSSFAHQAVLRFIYRTADSLKAANVMSADEQASIPSSLPAVTDIDTSLDSEEPDMPAELDGHSWHSRDANNIPDIVTDASEHDRQAAVDLANNSQLGVAAAHTEEFQLRSRKRKYDGYTKPKANMKSSKRHCQCGRQLLDGMLSVDIPKPRNPTKEDVIEMGKKVVGVKKAVAEAKKRVAEARDRYKKRISERTDEQLQWEKHHAEYQERLSEVARANQEEEQLLTALAAMGQ